MSRDWLFYLGEKIERFVTSRTFEAFLSDEAIFDAVLFNLQAIDARRFGARFGG